ncbi:MAG: hypothetical protein QXV62_05680, partial [Nitrososphaerota archaeon]
MPRRKKFEYHVSNASEISATPTTPGPLTPPVARVSRRTAIGIGAAAAVVVVAGGVAAFLASRPPTQPTT